MATAKMNPGEKESHENKSLLKFSPEGTNKPKLKKGSGYKHNNNSFCNTTLVQQHEVFPI